jgi:hypothetical protein
MNFSIRDYIHFSVFIVFILFFHCCKFSDKKNVSGDIINGNGPIKLDLQFETNLVQLESSDSCILSGIHCIDLFDQKLFIQDQYSVYIFDTDGRFIYKIKRGKGPGELLNPVSMKIDRNYKQILVNDMGFMIKVFDLAGKYIESYSTKHSFITFYRENEFDFLLQSFQYGEKRRPMVVRYNSYSDSITHSFLPTDLLPNPNITMVNFDNFSISTAGVFYHQASLRDIYKYNNQVFEKVYSLEFGKADLPSHLLQRATSFADLQELNKDNRYIDFIRYFYHFNNFSIVGIRYLQYTCAIIPKGENSFYFSRLNEIFNLPDIESVQNPISGFKNSLFFAINNLDFYELSNGEDPSVNKEISFLGTNFNIKINNNPIVLIIRVI